MLLTRSPVSLITRGLMSSGRASSRHSLQARSMVSGREILTDFANSMGNDPALAMECLARADAVCFDVDSTVVNEEGIDVLADYLGKGEEVAALTKQAMEGGMKFQDALAARLELLEPSKSQILNCLRERPLVLTDGLQELVEKLQKNHKAVYLVSGGFRIMIEPIADILKIEHNNIYANTILFQDDDSYLAFDANEPTSQDMGKPKALRMIEDAHKHHTMVMVGDGFTDSQAKPPAAAFIGFGGVVVRDSVKEVADWFVEDFQDMIHVIDKYSE